MLAIPTVANNYIFLVVVSDGPLLLHSTSFESIYASLSRHATTLMEKLQMWFSFIRAAVHRLLQLPRAGMGERFQTALAPTRLARK
jgi:hypothetical protein